MKKLVLLISAIIISIGLSAQKGKVTSALTFIDQGALDKAKEAIDEALVNEKTIEYSKTYFAVGKLAMACYESENPKFKALYKNPLVDAYKAREELKRPYRLAVRIWYLETCSLIRLLPNSQSRNMMKHLNHSSTILKFHRVLFM